VAGVDDGDWELAELPDALSDGLGVDATIADRGAMPTPAVTSCSSARFRRWIELKCFLR